MFNFSDGNQITIIALIVAVVLLLFWVLYNDIRLNRILRGKGSRNLEDSFAFFEREIKEFKKFKTMMEEYLEEVETRIQDSVRGVGIVRFNPWQGTGEGGNQSFAIAMISEKKDGIIISSLYSRDRFSAFAKNIKNGKSEQELSKEESEALQQAIQQLKVRKLEEN